MTNGRCEESSYSNQPPSVTSGPMSNSFLTNRPMSDDRPNTKYSEQDVWATGLLFQAVEFSYRKIYLLKHGSVCRRAQGRSLRHHAINDIIWRALLRAEVPSTREPAGLFRTDVKRPDGATLVPWSAGKNLAWDGTVVHTCAASYISPQAASAGPASVQAANRKALKYAALPTTHVFQPVAIETLGPLDPSAGDFINQIGSRMSAITFSACQWPSKDSILSLSLALSLQRLRTRPELPDNNIL